MLLLEPTPFVRGLACKTVDVVNYHDGQFAVQFEGNSLSFRTFDKIQTVEPGKIVENERLDAALAMVKRQQDTYESHRGRYHPARQRPPNNLEAPGQPTKGRPSRQIAAAVAAERVARRNPDKPHSPPVPPLSPHPRHPMERRGEVLSAWFPALRSRMARIDPLNGTRSGAQTTLRVVRRRQRRRARQNLRDDPGL
jgi:hypothetical protein